MALPRTATITRTGRLRPWQPRTLRRIDFTGYRYVVIDEIEGCWAVLAVTDWPGVDAGGRLRFPIDAPVEVDADVEALLRFLRLHRLPAALAERPLRHGDAFALRIRSRAALARAAGDETHYPEDWVRPPVYDVTRDARTASPGGRAAPRGCTARGEPPAARRRPPSTRRSASR